MAIYGISNILPLATVKNFLEEIGRSDLIGDGENALIPKEEVKNLELLTIGI